MLRDMSVPYEDPQALEAYCLPLIRGERRAATALELMASRYVAYATGAIDYVLATHNPATRKEIDRQAAENWSRSATWSGLEIVSTNKGGPEDDSGEVEFIARYTMNGLQKVHHEHSTFRRIDGVWYFIDGETKPEQPIRRASPKLGRNDACSCGSGKKYKKCCGGADAR
jgi:SEC-C motif-containing protein